MIKIGIVFVIISVALYVVAGGNKYKFIVSVVTLAIGLFLIFNNIVMAFAGTDFIANAIAEKILNGDQTIQVTI